MASTNRILALLLLLAAGWIIYLYATRPGPSPKPAVAVPVPAPAQQFNLLMHVDDPLPTIERMYNLFPNTLFTDIYFGDSRADSITKVRLKMPLKSGVDIFPKAAILHIQDSMRASGMEAAIHFVNLQIEGFPPLGIGSKKYTISPYQCVFPQNTDGKELFAQVMPWIILNTSRDAALRQHALQLGFDTCGVLDKMRGAIIKDPQGFIMLVQNPPPGK